MSLYLGIDTSNYTTSAALFDSESGCMLQKKKLLPVKEGELGLRQSDAVFHHTRQLPEMIEKLEINGKKLDAVGVSVRPRMLDNSYMPCFLCGEGLAVSLASVLGIPVYFTSHQIGHVLAALYSAGKTELLKRDFIAFHVSGGTTDCLLCEPDKNNVLNITEIGTSLDLKAGQAVDRIGLMLGLKFPCGAELEKLALNSNVKYKPKPVLKDGNCCLSGLENKCRKMLDEKESREDTANFCLSYIKETLAAMLDRAFEKYGEKPVCFAGGVMSDIIIREELSARYREAFFAAPEYSCDNAAGTAFFAKIRQEGLL